MDTGSPPRLAASVRPSVQCPSVCPGVNCCSSGPSDSAVISLTADDVTLTIGHHTGVVTGVAGCCPQMQPPSPEPRVELWSFGSLPAGPGCSGTHIFLRVAGAALGRHRKSCAKARPGDGYTSKHLERPACLLFPQWSPERAPCLSGGCAGTEIPGGEWTCPGLPFTHEQQL